MDRRGFVANATAVSIGSVFILPSISYGKSIKHTDSRGFQHLKNTSNLKEEKIPATLQSYLVDLKKFGFIDFSAYSFSYGQNYLLSAKKSGLIFSQSGHLFITKTLLGFDHVFINETQLAQLDELMYSYVEGIKLQDYSMNSTDFLLPHKILDRNKSNVSYANKYGNKINFKRSNRITKIFIS